MKKLLASLVAIVLFLGISTAALAHSNNTPGQDKGNWQQMMDYCIEMMNSYMNNSQDNIHNETSTSKKSDTGHTNSHDNVQSNMDNHQNQNHSMHDGCC